jgi:phage repressor protein C with HTH and peptisase S24 domain
MSNLLSERIQEIIDSGFTQADLYRAAGVTKGTSNQWIDGKIKSIKLEYALGIQALTGFNANWIVTGKGSKKISKEFKSNITVTHPDDAPDPNIINIKVSEVKFSAGNGHIAHYEILEDSGEASYQLSWFIKEGMKPENTKRFRVKGDSMEPFLYNNDTILVNFDEVNIVDGRLYAIRYGDELRVKYIHKLLNGSIILRSVNAFYKDEEVTPELANEHITIIGRVRDKSGRGGL